MFLRLGRCLPLALSLASLAAQPRHPDHHAAGFPALFDRYTATPPDAQGAVRFFDFVGANFRHALIDATVLRYLYPTGGPPGACQKTWPTQSSWHTGRRWHGCAPPHSTTPTTKAP